MSLRARLAVGYAILFLLALAVLELALYAVLQNALADEVDAALRERAEQIERAVMILGEQDVSSSTLTADIFPLAPSTSEELSAPGIHIRIFSPDGRTIASSSGIAIQLPRDDAALAVALAGRSSIATEQVNGTPVRVLYRPLRIGGQVRAVMQLGESLSPTERTLGRVRRLLMAGGAVALLGGLATGFFLTRQALRPVEQLTSTVKRIAETGEFDEHVPEPTTNDEIGRLATTFNDLLDRLHLLLDRQRTLVADTSHELRNPLMVVHGNVELLAHELPAEIRREAVTDTLEEVERMTRLVGDLLFLADADTGQAIARDEVALEEIVAGVVEDARRIAARDDGVREVALVCNDPITVLGDGGRLRQLVWNLVENAVRYTPPGGQVMVALHRRGPVAELTVSDTGIGIPPEHLPHIFERFYRVDKGRSRAVGGTGLGLSIVRQISEAHGGQVRVRSTLGEGSTFTVALPIAE